MSGGSLADPVYEQVNVETAPGYEYKADDGTIYGPFPAVAIFTWALRGMFEPTKRIRLAGRREFHPMQEYGMDILRVARIQLTNAMLDQKEWFYLDVEGNVQGPYAARTMVDYIGTRYMGESIKFYGRAMSQETTPAPQADDAGFRPYGDLLNDTLRAYRLEMQQWREETYGKPPAENGGEQKQMMNGGTEKNLLQDAAGSSDAVPLPILSPIPPAVDAVESHTSQPQTSPPHPELSFEQLKITYQSVFSTDQHHDWYLEVDGGCTGPYSTLTEVYSYLMPTTMLCRLPRGQRLTASSGRFLRFREILTNLHRAS